MILNNLDATKIKPVSKDFAIKNNKYYKIQPNDTATSIGKALHQQKLKYTQAKEKDAWLFIQKPNGCQIILDMRTVSSSYIYDAATGEKLQKFLNSKECIKYLLQNQTQYPEISDGTNSIYLDEYNIQKALCAAQKIQQTYGDSKISDSNITGDDYLLRIKQLIGIAYGIIHNNLVSNIFDLLPLKKNGTFPIKRKIVIYKNNITRASSEDGYVSSTQIALCIQTHGSESWFDHHDPKEEVNPHRARLIITSIDSAKKIYPLLDENLHVQDIKSKTSYLPNDQIQAGHIYQEKSGTEYLYLGNISIQSTKTATFQTTCKCGIYTAHHYIRATKKIKDLLSKVKSLDELLEIITNEKCKTYFDSPQEFMSVREKPRKFVKESGNPALCRTWRNASIPNGNECTVKPIFTTSVKYLDEGNIQMTYAVFIV